MSCWAVCELAIRGRLNMTTVYQYNYDLTSKPNEMVSMEMTCLRAKFCSVPVRNACGKKNPEIQNTYDTWIQDTWIHGYMDTWTRIQARISHKNNHQICSMPLRHYRAFSGKVICRLRSHLDVGIPCSHLANGIYRWTDRSTAYGHKHNKLHKVGSKIEMSILLVCITRTPSVLDVGYISKHNRHSMVCVSVCLSVCLSACWSYG